MGAPAGITAIIEEQQNTKLEVLYAKIDKIRADKERLTKLQKLDELKAIGQYEIRVEQNKKLEMKM